MNKSFVACAVFALLAVVAAGAAAKQEAVSLPPDKLVREVTESLLEDISVYRDALDEADSESRKQELLDTYFQELTTTLEPVVDFNWIALKVMGDYRKAASADQRRAFREVFKRGLVETYGRGLLTYSDQDIVVHPLDGDIGDKRRVTVKQEIQGRDQTYPLFYSMGLNRDGEWKVINVIINGINLGSTFRNQFQQAASTHDGDIAKVIETWTVKETYGTE